MKVGPKGGVEKRVGMKMENTDCSRGYFKRTHLVVCNSLSKYSPCTSVRSFYLVVRCSELTLCELIADYSNFNNWGVGITTGVLEKIQKINERERAIIQYSRV